MNDYNDAQLEYRSKCRIAQMDAGAELRRLSLDLDIATIENDADAIARLSRAIQQQLDRVRFETDVIAQIDARS